MAFGIPCLSTPISDSKRIIGQTGWIVSPQKPKEIVSVFEEILEIKKNKSWFELKNAANKRIEKNYSISKMIISYSNCRKNLA